LPAEDVDTMTSSTQLTPLQSSGSVIKIDIDSVIQQLLAVKDTPGKQVHCTRLRCFAISCFLVVKVIFIFLINYYVQIFIEQLLVISSSSSIFILP